MIPEKCPACGEPWDDEHTCIDYVPYDERFDTTYADEPEEQEDPEEAQ